MLTEGLSQELVPKYGIKVTSIKPRAVAIKFFDHLDPLSRF